MNILFLFPASVPPSIKDHGSESLSVVNVREGTSVSLECESNAVPPPVITWSKNGRMITDSTHVEILTGGQTLHIKRAEVHLWSLSEGCASMVGCGKAYSPLLQGTVLLVGERVINTIELIFIYKKKK